eukprot:gene1491-biopygen1235
MAEHAQENTKEVSIDEEESTNEADDIDTWTEEESKATGVSDTLLQEPDATQTTDYIIHLAPVNKFNERVFQDARGSKATVKAIDVVIGD